MSAGAIPTGEQEGRLWARGAEPPEDGEIPASFPNGFGAFYCASYPITGSQYAYFLNTLTPEQAAEHTQVTFSYASHYFPWAGGVHIVGEPPNCTYEFRRGGPAADGRLKIKGLCWVSWSDGAAWAAWAGLRPLTELEHEKVLHGPRLPARNEAGHPFWGGLSYGGGRYNAHPRERLVSVAHAAGLEFKGTHGVGSLTLPEDWPREDAAGVGARGGWAVTTALPIPVAWWCTSGRIHMAAVDSERQAVYGFRCARTAPEEAKMNSVRGEVEHSPVLLGTP
jgi:hypothetical protein